MGSLHLPRLSSTDGDWDNLGGNIGCIYVHSLTQTHKQAQRHTNKHIDTQTETNRQTTQTYTDTQTSIWIHRHTFKRVRTDARIQRYVLNTIFY